MAKDGQGRTVFVVTADFKGLYYLKNVTIQHEDAPVATALRTFEVSGNFFRRLALRTQKRHSFSPWVSREKPVRYNRCLLLMSTGLGCARIKVQHSLSFASESIKRVTVLLSLYHLQLFPSLLILNVLRTS